MFLTTLDSVFVRYLFGTGIYGFLTSVSRLVQFNSSYGPQDFKLTSFEVCSIKVVDVIKHGSWSLDLIQLLFCLDSKNNYFKTLKSYDSLIAD